MPIESIFVFHKTLHEQNVEVIKLVVEMGCDYDALAGFPDFKLVDIHLIQDGRAITDPCQVLALANGDQRRIGPCSCEGQGSELSESPGDHVEIRGIMDIAYQIFNEQVARLHKQGQPVYAQGRHRAYLDIAVTDSDLWMEGYLESVLLDDRKEGGRVEIKDFVKPVDDGWALTLQAAKAPEFTLVANKSFATSLGQDDIQTEYKLQSVYYEIGEQTDHVVDLIDDCRVDFGRMLDSAVKTALHLANERRFSQCAWFISSRWHYQEGRFTSAMTDRVEVKPLLSHTVGIHQSLYQLYPHEEYMLQGRREGGFEMLTSITPITPSNLDDICNVRSINDALAVCQMVKNGEVSKADSRRAIESLDHDNAFMRLAIIGIAARAPLDKLSIDKLIDAKIIGFLVNPFAELTPEHYRTLFVCNDQFETVDMISDLPASPFFDGYLDSTLGPVQRLILTLMKCGFERLLEIGVSSNAEYQQRYFSELEALLVDLDGFPRHRLGLNLIEFNDAVAYNRVKLFKAYEKVLNNNKIDASHNDNKRVSIEDVL